MVFYIALWWQPEILFVLVEHEEQQRLPVTHFLTLYLKDAVSLDIHYI